MGFLDTIDISASGLTAQRLRMDTIASNMANVETTRVQGRQGPYRRQVVVFEARSDNASGVASGSQFKDVLHSQMQSVGNGVRVKEIKEISETESPYRRVYDPSNPDADAQGYVNYPNVNIVEEMINMIDSTRSFEANAKVIDATKAMATQALQIGR